MKSVMLSIKPRFCELIADGKKTIEVRKTKPKIDTPFKCYIYETQSLYKGSGGCLFNGRGKVIGEFICDEIEDMLTNILNGKGNEHIRRGSCLLGEQLNAYAKGKNLFGWHISNLVIYENPKELSEFCLERPPQSWCYVKECEK